MAFLFGDSWTPGKLRNDWDSIATTTVPTARDDAVGGVNAHLGKEELEGVSFDVHVVDETHGLAYSTLFYAGGDLLEHAFAHVTIYL